MSLETVTKQNLSNEAIQRALDASFIRHTVDQDGEIMIEGQSRIFVTFNQAFILLRVYLELRTDLDELTRLQTLNRINSRYTVPRIYEVEPGLAIADLSLVLGNGVSARTLHDAVRFMNDFILSIPELRAILVIPDAPANVS